MAPPWGSNVLHRENVEKSCLIQKAWAIDIWYIASSSGPLPSLFELYSWGQKWSRPGGQLYYMGLYRKT